MSGDHSTNAVMYAFLKFNRKIFTFRSKLDDIMKFIIWKECYIFTYLIFTEKTIELYEHMWYSLEEFLNMLNKTLNPQAHSQLLPAFIF